jgi:hypothetical protein
MENAPRAIPGVLHSALTATAPPGDPPVLPCYEALNFGSPNEIDVEAAACAVPASRTVEAADALIAFFQERAEKDHAYITSPLGLRFVKAAEAHLSPQHGRDTCMIEAPFLRGTDFAFETIDAFHDLLFKHFEGRPHWGQVNRRMNKERLRALYRESLPRFLEAFGALDPLGLFDAPFSEQMGFSELAEELVPEHLAGVRRLAPSKRKAG